MLATHHLAQIERRRGALHAAATRYLASLRLCVQLDDVRMVGRCLAGLGAASLALGDAEAAARLLGAAMARIESVPPFLAPCDSDDYATLVDAARASLSPAAYAAAWQQGRTLPLEELVASAERLAARPAEE